MLFASSGMSFSTFVFICVILIAVGMAHNKREKEKKAAAEHHLYYGGTPSPPSFKRSLALSVGSSLIAGFVKGLFGHHGQHHHR